MRKQFWMGLATWMWVSASGAGALPIILNGTGTAAPGTQAGDAFALAAQRVGALFVDPVTVFIDIAYSNLGMGILGETTSNLAGIYDFVDDFRLDLSLDITSLADLQSIVNQPFGALEMWQNDVNANYFFDNDGSYNNEAIAVTRANARALGYTLLPGPDASITFSDAVNWDFNPDDGITAGQFDFVGVAMHEILHTMGFSSGVNDIDFYTGLGPDAGLFDLQNDYWYRPLDIFRYGQNGQQDLTTGPNTYFSIDGGASNYGFFSTGFYNGDGQQPGHWRDSRGFGLMDPTLSPGERGIISDRDLLAMDVIGWDLATPVNAQALIVPELDGGTATLPFAFAIAGLLLAQGRRRRKN